LKNNSHSLAATTLAPSDYHPAQLNEHFISATETIYATARAYTCVSHPQASTFSLQQQHPLTETHWRKSTACSRKEQFSQSLWISSVLAPKILYVWIYLASKRGIAAVAKGKDHVSIKDEKLLGGKSRVDIEQMCSQRSEYRVIARKNKHSKIKDIATAHQRTISQTKSSLEQHWSRIIFPLIIS
jgi:hypothetical protein